MTQQYTELEALAKAATPGPYELFSVYAQHEVRTPSGTLIAVVNSREDARLVAAIPQLVEALRVAQQELEEWRFTNKVDELQRSHDALAEQLRVAQAENAKLLGTVHKTADIAEKWRDDLRAERDALQAKLDALEKQEPVAEMEPTADGCGVMRFKETSRRFVVGDKLYLAAGAAPQQIPAGEVISRWPAPLNHPDDKETPDEAWESHWKDIVTNADGSINLPQLKLELSDCSMLMRYYEAVLCDVTGNRISKWNTHPSAICSVFGDYLTERVEEAVKEALEEAAEALPEDVGAVVACLGDDAAALRDENPESEIAANMDKAALMLIKAFDDGPDRSKPPCLECGAKTAKESETMCICNGDKDHCHGVELWPDGGEFKSVVNVATGNPTLTAVVDDTKRLLDDVLLPNEKLGQPSKAMPVKLDFQPGPADHLDVIFANGWNAAVDAYFANQGQDISPIASQESAGSIMQIVHKNATYLIELATALRLVVTIEREPLPDLAMGNARYVVSFREKRSKKQPEIIFS